MADIVEQTSFTDAATAISQGKRHLLVRDYTAAVTAFAEGLELLSQKHGDQGDELGEPCLLYGRALLGLVREESEVLGGAVPGSEETEEDGGDEEGDDDKLSNVDEKEEDDGEDGEDAAASTDSAIESAPVKETEKKDDSKVKKAEETKTEEEKPQEKVDKDEGKTEEGVAGSSKGVTANGKCSTAETNGNVPSGSGADDEDDVNKEDDEEDAGRGIDLQVAWEVLELARKVFDKRGPSGLKQLAEAYRLLGEVAMESGNHDVAVKDLEKAQKILQEIEPNNSRAMAELHYQLGLAQSLVDEFDASIEQFKIAASLLEARIKELESTEEPPKTDDPFYTIEGEIDELKELLPEIQEKIADMKDIKEEQRKSVLEDMKRRAADHSANGAGPSGSSSSADGPSSCAVSPKQNKPASDISHLVRKKRKADEPEPIGASPCKKPTP